MLLGLPFISSCLSPTPIMQKLYSAAAGAFSGDAFSGDAEGFTGVGGKDGPCAEEVNWGSQHNIIWDSSLESYLAFMLGLDDISK